MNPVDHAIIAFLNQFAQRSCAFDSLVVLLATNYLLKTGLIVALMFWLWFRNDEKSADRRATLVFGLVASTAAVVLARLLSFAVTFRERPLRNPDLHFVLPNAVGSQAILGWNSFPSDNATLFFGIATCIFLVSRRGGVLALWHTFVVVGLARVYLGFHYPTDILAGALIGAGTVSLVAIPSLKTAVTRLPMRWMKEHPPSFHAALGLGVFLISTTFEPLYPIVRVSARLAEPTIEALRVERLPEALLIISALIFLAIALAFSHRRKPTDRRHRPLIHRS